jgi:hypothetical protein
MTILTTIITQPKCFQLSLPLGLDRIFPRYQPITLPRQSYQLRRLPTQMYTIGFTRAFDPRGSVDCIAEEIESGLVSS